ncbi:MAG TPA: DUF1588 domain-containing protein [Polyangiaceae bacterium]|nr:DUF1588 domain-containing protein [Polyangiaceae bacterium]
MSFRFWGISVASLLALSALGCGQSKAPPAMQNPSGGSGGMPMTGPQSCDAPSPGPAPLHPLTRFQYDNIVRDLLGDTSHPAQAFPPENEVDGYRTNYNANQANPSLVESYLTAAEAVAASAVTDRLNDVAPCADGGTTECGHAFVSSFATRAFRRPLTDAELTPLTALFDAGSMQGYAKGIELVIQAVLQSPQFLYRVDSLRSPTTESGAMVLGGYELAGRLAFSLWGSVPDQALLDSAAQGTLATPADVEREARRMLEDPRAHDIVRDFGEQWLNLSRLDGAVRSGTDVDAAKLDSALRASLTSFLDATYFSKKGTFEQLFSDDKVWVDGTLAGLYGGSEPAASGLEAQTLPDPRYGLLTQPALLTLLSHADQTAPVIRGVFVRERILCLQVAPPPPTVNAVPPDPDPNATTRERFRQHTEQEACAGCHKLIDGIGFGFERYDQLGRYRATENGLDVDESGQILATGDADLDGDFANAAEMLDRIAKSPMARDCLATNWYRYTFGRQEMPEDTCSLAQVKDRFAKSGGDLKELIVGLTQTDSFLYRPAMEAP